MDGCTRDVEDMLSDHRHAINRMTVPLLLGMLVTTIQVFVDTFWCSGLGSDEMAAISVSGPLYWTIANLGVGMGVGVTTAVARALGAGDRDRADSLASQTVFISLVISLVLSTVALILSEPLLRFMTGSDDIALSMDYVFPYILFSLPMVLSGTLSGLLRGEGAARRVSAIAFVSCAANIVLDPIFIYGFGWGVTGASLATCMTFCISASIMLWWYLSGRMFIRPSFKGFRFNMEQQRDMLAVGIPQMVQMALGQLMIAPQNAIIMATGGDAGMICVMLSFNFILLAIIPANAMGSAAVSVASAAMGQHDFDKVEACFRYTFRTSIAISVCLSIVLAVFASPLTAIFTSSGDMAQYHEEMTMVLRIYSISTTLNGIICMSGAVMQTLKCAAQLTVLMFLRECIFITFYLIASLSGMYAIYWALVAVNAVTSLMLFMSARYFMSRRRDEFVSSTPS